jgi:hypothetical protein
MGSLALLYIYSNPQCNAPALVNQALAAGSAPFWPRPKMSSPARPFLLVFLKTVEVP